MVVFVVKCVHKSDSGINSAENVIAFLKEEDAIRRKRKLEVENKNFDVEYRVEILALIEEER